MVISTNAYDMRIRASDNHYISFNISVFFRKMSILVQVGVMKVKKFMTVHLSHTRVTPSYILNFYHVHVYGGPSVINSEISE